MKIRWEVDDGYIGKSRPHFITIEDDEIEDMSETEIDDYIEERVKEDFENKIYYSWSVVDEYK